MSRIPLESSETLDFNPVALAKIDPAPVFVLAAASRRVRREFDAFIASRYTYYSSQNQKDELYRGMRALFPAEEAEANIGMMDNWFTARDDYDDAKSQWRKDNDHWLSDHEGEKLPEDRAEYPAFEFPDAPALALLEDNVRSRWTPLQVMSESNMTYEAMRFRAYPIFVLKEWRNIDFPVERDAKGRLTEASIDALEDALAELTDEMTAKVAMTEIIVTAMQRIYLLKDLEKNLPSPPPSTLNPSDTTTEQPDLGASPESAISSETPGATSPATSEN